MEDRQFTNGIVVFVTALGLSALSSFVGHLALFGDATNFAQGFLDGLSVVACGAAIVLLARSRRRVS
ncbi:MAG: hypothetical protein JXM73_15530 [Anaerolineae bacterium]|nr:hypothetical protein [Anaerolineae bacterium]